MANREKGEVSVQVGDKTYTLCVDMHAWALAQDALTRGDDVPSLDLISKRLVAEHMLSIIAVVWAALQRYHGDEIKTLRQTSELMKLSEGAVGNAVVRAVNASSADPADLKELGRPTGAQGDNKTNRGIGGKPISEPVGSA